MKHLDLFSGIGGFSLGLERAGMETIAFCESNPKKRRLLNHHWPGVPIYEDVNELPKIECPIVTAGWPCQGNSTATRGRSRHPDMWPAVERVLDASRPYWFIGENVLGLGTEGVDKVLDRLRDHCLTPRAYRFDIAPPERSRGRWRWIFVAHAYGESEPLGALDAQMARVPSLAGCDTRTVPGAVGVAARLSHRMDRMHALGDAIPPQIPEIIGRAIMAIENDQTPR